MENITLLSYDGRQLITRIPRQIATENKLIRGDSLVWKTNQDKITLRGLHQTDIEKIMADALKGEGIEFVEQYPIRGKYGYILDFALADKKIAIECDGEHWHDKDRDRRRDAVLKSLGWKVIRFRGKEIINDIQLCLSKLKQEVLK